MSERSSASHVRRYTKALAVVVFMVLVAAACSSDGFPQSYDEQPQTNDQGVTVSLTEANWLEGCTVSLGEELAEEANTVCQCSYNELSGPNGIPFLEFSELNDSLKSNPENLIGESQSDSGAQLVEIVKNCIAGG